jgi:Flp pilus assembly protein TadG
MSTSQPPASNRHSRRLRRRLFVHDERGATAIEFALLAVPFFGILCAIFETALIFMAGEVLDSAVADANRWILTGQAQEAGFDIEDYRSLMCTRTFGLLDCSRIHLQIESIETFAEAEVTIPVDPECEEDCEWTEPELYTPGQGSDVVLVRAYYRWPLILDFMGFGMDNMADGTRLLGAVHIFRNEPFT